MPASAQGAVDLLTAKLGKAPGPELKSLIEAVFEEIAANGTFSAAAGSVSGSTVTQAGPTPLTQGAVDNVTFDYP